MMLVGASQGQPTRPDQQQQGVTSSSNNSLLPPPAKKDVFMSRGWGASGMPFTMFYLNHYTKAHKAYTQQYNQQQQQQQQLEKLRKHEAEQDRLRAVAGDQVAAAGFDEQPRMLPYGSSRYAEPQPNAQQQSEQFAGNNRGEDEYADSAVYLPAKPSSPRRQYNIPQLFVSYGWGPMG